MKHPPTLPAVSVPPLNRVPSPAPPSGPSTGRSVGVAPLSPRSAQRHEEAVRNLTHTSSSSPNVRGSSEDVQSTTRSSSVSIPPLALAQHQQLPTTHSPPPPPLSSGRRGTVGLAPIDHEPLREKLLATSTSSLSNLSLSGSTEGGPLSHMSHHLRTNQRNCGGRHLEALAPKQTMPPPPPPSS
eukprot:PhM_4_TR15878/c0_g1_i1/m.84849